MRAILLAGIAVGATLGCAEDASPPNGTAVSSTRQASSDTEGISRAGEMKPPQGAAHRPTVPVPTDVPAVIPPDRCPLSKSNRADWAVLQADKARAKAEAEAAAAALGDGADALPPVPEEYQQRQREFLATVASADTFKGLTQEERERAYDDLKRKMLGE